MRAKFTLVCIFSMAIAAGGFAYPQGEPADSFAVARLDNGANVGFAMVRSGSVPAGGPISDVVMPRSRGVSRVLYDQKSGAFFGYRLEIEIVPANRYRLVFKALAADIDSELKRYARCTDCPQPTLLPGSQPRFPAPLNVAAGDICTLDLLINPQSGETIVDVIAVSAQTISRETMRLAAGRIREALQHTLRGDNLVARGNLEDAITEFQKSLAINPNSAAVQTRLGVSLQRSGKIDQAQRRYEMAVKLNPRYAEAWNNLGSCYHIRGKHRQALGYYQKAIDNKPSFAAAYKNMGSAYFAQGRFEEGYQSFEAAFRLDPAILEPNPGMDIPTYDGTAATQYFYFAKLSAANEQYDAAINFLKKAVDKGFKDCASIKRDANFQKMMSDPQYKQIMEKVCP